MEKKVLIVCQKKGLLLDSLEYYFERERVEYVISDAFRSSEDFTNIIYISDVNHLSSSSFQDISIPIILISDQKYIIENSSGTKNYIITSLIDSTENYTMAQREYLFKSGVYCVFFQKIAELLENVNHYNGMIYDLTAIEDSPIDWVFHFESIRDTYDWLYKKNASVPADFVQKRIHFYDDKIFDDSLREINYLTQKLIDIKEKKRGIDLFICTKDQFQKLRDNYFFKALLNNISDTYQIYLIDRDQLESQDSLLMSKLLDGIAIYEDCVYRDTFDDEFSLGLVDCNRETVLEYNRYFDFILDTYSSKIDLGE